MKTRELLFTGVLLATAAYAVWMTVSASRLRTELTALEASHLRLEENHRQMRKSVIQLGVNPGTRDETFRKLLAVLEADGGADLNTSSNPGTTRVNEVPDAQIQ